MNKKYFYKVKLGFAKHEYIIIEAGPDLERALYAFIEGDVVTMIKGRAIRGKHIIGIEPDVHSYTGWHRSYEPKDGADFAQIERDVPKEIDGIMTLYTERVDGFIASNNHAMIGKEMMVPTLGKSEQYQLTSGRS